MNHASKTIKAGARKERTLSAPVDFAGIGIHSGKEVTIRFLPSPPGSGIVFRRIDLPGKPEIKASIDHVQDTMRSTTIGSSGVQVFTVEHVLSAVSAYSIDNLVIELTDVEPPVGNGSADIFVEMIEQSGIIEQNQEKEVYRVVRPILWEEGDRYIAAFPYDNGFRISYTLHYPESKVLQGQFHSVELSPEIFKKEIAMCRTFSRYEEVEFLIDKGLIKGGSLSNTVVVKDEAVFSKEGLFFSNEMARHKILDIIGDLSLIGIPLEAHIVAQKTGHAANISFAETLIKHLPVEVTH